jgi:hypothetical protein
MDEMRVPFYFHRLYKVSFEKEDRLSHNSRWDGYLNARVRDCTRPHISHECQPAHMLETANDATRSTNLHTPPPCHERPGREVTHEI